MPDEYICDIDYLILKFENVDEAVCFAHEMWPDSMAYELMYEDNQDEEAWICVLAICDVCKRESIFFAPAEVYDDSIIGCECSDCGNKSVYPQEGSFEDTN